MDALAAACFVERSSDPTDGRVVFVTMTVAGVKVLDDSRRRKDAVLVAAVPVLQRLLDDEPS